MYMYALIYIYMCTYMHTYIHIHIYIYIHTYNKYISYDTDFDLSMVCPWEPGPKSRGTVATSVDKPKNH